MFSFILPAIIPSLVFLMQLPFGGRGSGGGKEKVFGGNLHFKKGKQQFQSSWLFN